MLRNAIGAGTHGWRAIVTIFRQLTFYIPIWSGLIESLRFWREQKRIQLWMDKNSQWYDEEMEKARASNASAEHYEKIENEHQFEQLWAEEELRKLHSGYYIRLANKLVIPVPPFQMEGGAWETSMRGGWHLTPAAMHDLRAAIRAERQARRQDWLMWIPLLALAVSIISTLTALVAVWEK